MEDAVINRRKYTFIKNYKDNTRLRKSFNDLTQKIYGFDFEHWYQSGYWENSYIPYSLMDDEKIIANISVSTIDFLVLGEIKRYIQIGTVMTDTAYRNKGLARYLMEKIITDWDNKCDAIYLFANDGVLDFYPKFGFEALREYQYSKTISNDNERISAEKLNMSEYKNRELLMKAINESVLVSKLSMLNNAGLIMFYCTSFMKDNVFYLEELNVIAIGEYKGDTLYLLDLFSLSDVNIDNVIKLMTNKDIHKVILGFTPVVTDGFIAGLLKEDDTTLFVMKMKDKDLFQNNKMMFPVLSHT